MTTCEYLRWDVFTDRPLAGNQLAVLLEADGIDPDTMQRIANEFALPETAFVVAPGSPEADFRVRIFTPERELAMAGHPTVGTAFALARAERLEPGASRTVFELGIGPTPVLLEWRSERLVTAWMSQPAPEFGQRSEDLPAVAGALGVEAADIAAAELPVQVVSAGVALLFVPLRSRAAVDSAALDRAKLVEVCEAMAIPELPVYVFTLEPGDDDAMTYSRMFAPVFGIQEDPATGGASGPLAAYLACYRPTLLDGRDTLINIQGVRMNRPSRIHITPDAEAPVESPLLVGGTAVLVGEGRLYL